jgi:hypothetical protein
MVSDPTPAIPSEPITKLTVSPTTVNLGQSVQTNVTVSNGLASYTATSNITVYANNTVVIGTQNNVNVTAGATKTLTFTWNTTTVTSGTYVIKAVLSGKVVISGTTYTFHDSDTGPSVTVSGAVLPEFQQSLFLPLLLLMTSATAILAKTVWSKKSKNVPTAPQTKAPLT